MTTEIPVAVRRMPEGFVVTSLDNRFPAQGRASTLYAAQQMLATQVAVMLALAAGGPSAGQLDFVVVNMDNGCKSRPN